MELEMTPFSDANTLLAINNAAMPDLNELSVHKARWLVEHCVMPGLAMLDGQIVGMIVVLDDISGFDSDYYRWFTDRYANFLYIDRITVTPWARGKGIAKQLYQTVEDAAHQKGMAIAADVYSEPPNIASLRLHYAMGFQEVGRQHFPGDKKIASKFMKYEERAKKKPLN